MAHVKGDIIGKRFGRLIVIKFTHINKHGQSVWECICDCGAEATVSRSQLISGKTISCGCATLKHGYARRGRIDPTYITWRNMRNRCRKPSNKDYPNYGGRGITVCARWLNSFENFILDMGPKPLGMTIDRIENDGNYEPGNCKWSTSVEQSHNRRCMK